MCKSEKSVHMYCIIVTMYRKVTTYKKAIKCYQMLSNEKCDHLQKKCDHLQKKM